jgi:hypothetical protein
MLLSTDIPGGKEKQEARKRPVRTWMVLRISALRDEGVAGVAQELIHAQRRAQVGQVPAHAGCRSPLAGRAL